MSDEIVRRLFGNKSRNYLTESLKSLHEVDEEEDEEEEMSPQGDEDITPIEDTDTEDTEDFEVPEEEPSLGRGPLFNDDPMDDTPDEEGEVPEPEDSEDDTEVALDSDEENVNPLDNPYAVKFKLGDDVVLSYANGTKTEMKGSIEGYDKLGFYRIKWADGMTTNGITDIALLDLVDTKVTATEGRCICGSKKRIREGKDIVCDKCGRVLKESPRILGDDDGEKIRAEHRPMSTSRKSGMEESIKKAFSRKKVLKEETADEDVFSRLYTLEGEFWTRLQEIVADIEDLGYDVLEANDEYIIVGATEDDEDYEIQIFLGGTDRTKTLDFKRVRR